MRLPWRREARPIEPSHMVSSRRAELKTTKEILAERRWAAEQTHLPEDGLWPATFCLGE